MKNYILIVLLLSFSSISSQNDQKAEELLNKVSKKIDASNSYLINFTYTIEKDTNLEGSALISKEKYYT